MFRIITFRRPPGPLWGKTGSILVAFSHCRKCCFGWLSIDRAADAREPVRSEPMEDHRAPCEVLLRMAAGKLDKQIAFELGLVKGR